MWCLSTAATASRRRRLVTATIHARWKSIAATITTAIRSRECSTRSLQLARVDDPTSIISDSNDCSYNGDGTTTSQTTSSRTSPPGIQQPMQLLRKRLAHSVYSPGGPAPTLVDFIYKHVTEQSLVSILVLEVQKVLEDEAAQFVQSLWEKVHALAESAYSRLATEP
jgi:hypothetical protein